MVFYVPNDHLSGISRPVDQNLFASVDLPYPRVKATSQPTSPHKENHEKGVDDKNGEWILFQAKDPMNQKIKYDRAHHNTADNVSKIPDPRVPPQSLIELKGNKSQPPNHNEPGHHLD